MGHSTVVALTIPVLVIVGCAALNMRPAPSRVEGNATCQEYFKQLDMRTEWVEARDASSFTVPGFSYLRINRFLAAMGKDLKAVKAKDQWVDLMQRLDLSARQKEIRNLPPSGNFGAASGEEQTTEPNRVLARLKSCSDTLLAYDRRQPSFVETLQSRSQVPDDYSTLMRVVGVYPVMSIPVAIASKRVQEKIRDRFKKDLGEIAAAGVLKFYAPTEPGTVSDREIADILAHSMDNPLKIPIVDRSREKELAAALAPVFIQDVAAPYDLPGRVVRSGDDFSVDTSKPTVYYYVSYAILHCIPVFQLNYVTWYSARAGRSSPWIERGRFDGLTVRMSLDDRGKVFMVDIMNNCGCYHFFVPRKGSVFRARTGGSAFGPLVPQWLPDIPGKSRMGIRVSSGAHQVQRVTAVTEPANRVLYELLPYETLESLPDGKGHNVSMFDENGIVRGSERIERFLLFPMGIPSEGSMRQRGHHPIEMIGRDHFDDPYLFERNFRFK